MLRQATTKKENEPSAYDLLIRQGKRDSDSMSSEKVENIVAQLPDVYREMILLHRFQTHYCGFWICASV